MRGLKLYDANWFRFLLLVWVYLKFKSSQLWAFFTFESKMIQTQRLLWASYKALSGTGRTVMRIIHRILKHYFTHLLFVFPMNSTEMQAGAGRSQRRDAGSGWAVPAEGCMQRVGGPSGGMQAAGGRSQWLDDLSRWYAQDNLWKHSVTIHPALTAATAYHTAAYHMRVDINLVSIGARQSIITQLLIYDQPNTAG